MPQYLFENLSDHHNKADFSCGEPSLDHYLHRQAGQDIKRHISAVYVLGDLLNPSQILGYYSLSSLSVDAKGFPEKIKKQLPKYPVLPVTLIGRLAVDKNCQGQKLGELLLLNALERCFLASQTIGAMAVIVDALNNSAVQFYKQYGFIAFDDSPRLFLPMKTIQKLLER